MLAFPEMLEAPAKQAGMKVPPNTERFSKLKFPHFHIFCKLQLNRRMKPGEQWNNAKVIAAIPEKELKKMTLEDFIAKGLEWAT